MTTVLFIHIVSAMNHHIIIKLTPLFYCSCSQLSFFMCCLWAALYSYKNKTHRIILHHCFHEEIHSKKNLVSIDDWLLKSQTHIGTFYNKKVETVTKSAVEIYQINFAHINARVRISIGNFNTMASSKGQ